MIEAARRGRLALRTIRHLRGRQLLALLWHRAGGRFRIRPPHQWEPWNSVAARTLGAVGPAREGREVGSSVAAFRTGSVEVPGRRLSWREAVTDGVGVAPLSSYRVQYHDVLADAAWVAAREADEGLTRLITDALTQWCDWWSQRDGVAWDAYPVSVRLVNWSRILGLLPQAVSPAFRHLHAAHVDLLDRSVEWHLEGNHVLRNAAALVIGSHCWQGRRAASVQQRAARLYWRELLAQVADDGIHEERSPMYHLIALRDALEVVIVRNACNVPTAEAVRERIRAMAEITPWLRRCDGSVFLLHDTAGDHGLDVDRTLELAASVVGATIAPPRGTRIAPRARLLFAAVPGTADRLLMDLGPPAPGHQPGHAHAGALGIDMDLGGVPFLVDPGCSGYEGDPWRAFFRSTAAHNTVRIDSKDQSEMWATFRIARRATVAIEEIASSADEVSVSAACVPYHDRSTVHRRELRLLRKEVVVEDRVERAAGKPVDVFWHVHPDWEVRVNEGVVEARHRRGSLAVMRFTGQDMVSVHKGERAPAMGWYASGFGKVQPSWSIRVSVAANDGRILRAQTELLR